MLFPFQNATKIQFLDLSHNNFGDAAGMVLGPAIADNTCLKELDISWNCIRRKGSIAVTQGLKVINTFPNKPCFLRVCSTSFLKTLW